MVGEMEVRGMGGTRTEFRGNAMGSGGWTLPQEAHGEESGVRG